VRRISYIFGSVSTPNKLYFRTVNTPNKILIFSGVFAFILLYVMQCYVNTTLTEVVP
jgi:hypothetical protein